MTEKEAIKKVREFGLYHAIGDLPNSALTVKAFKMAVTALEEIQKYRAIGTVEEVKRMQRYSALAKKHSTIGQVIDSCAEYEAIGTVEECREARERQRAKKPIRINVGHNGSSTDGCPVCKRVFYEKFNFCPDCGTYLDWSEK